MGAIQLKSFIDQLDPTAIVVEAPADAHGMITHLADPSCRPPVAVLSFTKRSPVRSVLFPLASYSPEWIAIREGLRRGIEVHFMDVPSSIILTENYQQDGEDVPIADALPASRDSVIALGPKPHPDDPFEAIAKLAGDVDHDTWWERTFEHNANPDAYRAAIDRFGLELRALNERSRVSEPETLMRERHMRRVLREVLLRGHESSRVVVVCGAYHASVLTAELPAMDDVELSGLSQAECMHTLMPYSYRRLSGQSGYGAGNSAPAYYQMLFDTAREGLAAELPTRFLTAVAASLRSAGLPRSSAAVIEAVRLAHALAALHGSASAPTLRDLTDAAVACLGFGEAAPIERASKQVAIGVEFGAVGALVGRTSLQKDFDATVAELRLGPYLKDTRMPIKGRAEHHGRPALDLREDRRAASVSSAFRDRDTSIFLHRLHAIELGFAVLEYSGTARAAHDPRGGNSAEPQNTFKEVWSAQWTPECEILLVENSLRGDSVSAAATHRLLERLTAAQSLDAAVAIAVAAMSCELQPVLDAAAARVGELAIDDTDFAAIASAARQLSDVRQYGTVRKLKLTTVDPLLSQLLLRGVLSFSSALFGDATAARLVAHGMVDLHWVMQTSIVAQESALVARWISALHLAADNDAAHPYLAGVATALLLESGQIDDATLDRRIALRLSVGVHPTAVAEYFEGLSSRNRFALLQRRSLWDSLSQFVESLTNEEFLATAVGLRRAFGGFEPGENRRVAEILSDIWGKPRAALASEIDRTISEAELNDLNFAIEALKDLDL
jgi:hypothetical protein